MAPNASASAASALDMASRVMGARSMDATSAVMAGSGRSMLAWSAGFSEMRCDPVAAKAEATGMLAATMRRR